MEVYSRLDDDTMNSTIQSLESLIYSHQMLGSTLSRTFLNPKSSITNSIYQALNTISSIIRSSSLDTQQLLQSYLDCYNSSMDYIIQTLVAQIDLTRQNMFSQLKLFSMSYLYDHSYNNAPFLEYLLTQIESMLNSMNFSQKQLYHVSFPACPTSFVDNGGSCSAYFTGTTDQLNETSLLLQILLADNESTTTSQIIDYYYSLASRASSTQLSMSGLEDCVTKYQKLLEDFSNFLKNDIFTAFSTASAQSDTNLNLMNTVNEDIAWLINIANTYVAGNISKQSLSQQFLSVVDSRLLLDVTSVVNAIDQTILFDVNNQIAKMQANLVFDYLKLLNYLMRMHDFFLSSDTFEKLARGFNIWRKPIYQRDNPTVSQNRRRREFLS